MYLCSDSDGDEEVKGVTVEDKGSHPRYAEVSVQGVLLEGGSRYRFRPNHHG